MLSIVQVEYQSHKGEHIQSCSMLESEDNTLRYSCEKLGTEIFLHPINTTKFLSLDIYGYGKVESENELNLMKTKCFLSHFRDIVLQFRGMFSREIHPGLEAFAERQGLLRDLLRDPILWLQQGECYS